MPCNHLTCHRAVCNEKTYVEKSQSEKTHDNPQTRPIIRIRTLRPDHPHQPKIKHQAVNRRVSRRMFLSLAPRQHHRPIQPPASRPHHRCRTPRDPRRHPFQRRLRKRRLRRSRRHRSRIPAQTLPPADLPRPDPPRVRPQHHSQPQSTALLRRHLCPSRHPRRPHQSSPTPLFNAEPPPHPASEMHIRVTTSLTQMGHPRLPQGRDHLRQRQLSVRVERHRHFSQRRQHSPQTRRNRRARSSRRSRRRRNRRHPISPRLPPQSPRQRLPFPLTSEQRSPPPRGCPRRQRRLFEEEQSARGLVISKRMPSPIKAGSTSPATRR